jgi:hypothetical protein
MALSEPSAATLSRSESLQQLVAFPETYTWHFSSAAFPTSYHWAWESKTPQAHTHAFPVRGQSEGARRSHPSTFCETIPDLEPSVLLNGLRMGSAVLQSSPIGVF